MFEKGLTKSNLDTIAYTSMFIDHIAAVILGYFLFKIPNTDPVFYKYWVYIYEFLRSIGRFAFPIFAFSLVDGYRRTKNLKRYFLRLGLLAIISEPFFDLALYNSYFTTYHQNVIFTLLIGLLVITLTDKFQNKFLGILFVLGGMFLADFLNTDFGGYGVLIIFGFFVLKESEFRYPIMALALAFQTPIAAVSLLFIYYYNGEKGNYSKYKYLFYPLHFLVLFIILQFLK